MKPYTYILYYAALNGLFAGAKTNASIFTQLHNSLDLSILDIPALVTSTENDRQLWQLQSQLLQDGNTTSFLIKTNEGPSYFVLYPESENNTPDE